MALALASYMYIDEDPTTLMPSRRERMGREPRLPPVLYTHLDHISQMPPRIEGVHLPHVADAQPTFPSSRFGTTVRLARSAVRRALTARVRIQVVARIAAFMALAIFTGLVIVLVIRERAPHAPHLGAYLPVPEPTAVAPVVLAAANPAPAQEPSASATIEAPTKAPASKHARHKSKLTPPSTAAR